MGGKAAKERRRLERLSMQNTNSTNKETDAKKQTPQKTEKVFSFQQTKIRRNNAKSIPRRGPEKQSKHHVKKPMTKHEATKLKKKQTVKKPKHLKRKLEQATDESTKHKLEEELKQLKTRKELFSLQSKSHNPPKKLRMRKDEPSRQAEVSLSSGEHSHNSFEKERDSSHPSTQDKGVENIKSNLAKEPTDNNLSTPLAPSTDQKIKERSNLSSPTKILMSNDNDESSSSDDEIEEPVKRQRGRRRRGRKDTDKRVKELEEQNCEKAIAESMKNDEGDNTQINKLEESGQKRRCLGRKPVTDFKIGEKYSGEVVYIKPFGVFIDIMCHSEAFCHVSRVQDGYVNSPDEILTIGDKVVARIVEIDRKLKRITVSLQTDERIADELASVEAHKARLSKREKKKEKNSSIVSSQKMIDPLPSAPDTSTEESNTDNPVDSQGNYLKSESEMNPAELKRARKLARRAQRRAQKEATGLSA
mmetsp:Transcript_4390/g.6823  ORF Transcript_4390/g.6823 Transcript_4390/m.6823 type:complete len:475 (-) Transcript_4390:8-1432(-)